MRLGLVGNGVVGRALVRAYVEHVEEVRVHDVLPERSTHALADVLACDLIFVCLPTPQRQTGAGLDCSIIDEFFGSIAGSDVCLVLRSTVPIGTTRELQRTYRLPHLCHSPEFLTARCAATDAMTPSRNVIGVPSVRKQRCDSRLLELYLQRFSGVPIFIMTSDESEALKLIQNAFFATKISFMNEARSLVDGAGLNWEAILAALLADGRISHSHVTVPGPDGRHGFGGECLPKDLSQFIDELDRRGLRADVSAAVERRNAHDRGRKT